MLEQVSDAKERTLGPDHPDTLDSRHGLAVVLIALGDNAAARGIFRQVAEARSVLSVPATPKR
jgi:hypothetical protein